MATEEEMETVSNAAQNWTPNDVVKWLGSIGLQQYGGVFLENAIGGAELMYLDKEDMRDGLGIRKVGHRIKLVRELERFQQVHRVAQKNLTLVKFQQHYWLPCLHPFKKRFRVTQASIEWRINNCFGSSHHQVARRDSAGALFARLGAPCFSHSQRTGFSFPRTVLYCCAPLP